MSWSYGRLVIRFRSTVARHRVDLSGAATGLPILTERRHDSEPESALVRSFGRDRAAGRARNCTFVAALVDTNVLVYRFDARFPDKQTRATELLRSGLTDDSIRVPHQALIEFVAATTKPLTRNGPSILSPEDARREMEEMLVQFEVLYPDEELVRVAIRGAATYGLSWVDAHLWAYAERFGLDTLWSEDFENGRLYGRVRARDPFVASA